MNEEKWQSLVLVIKQIAKDKGITNAVIAEKTGFQQSNVNRMLNAKYPPKLDNFITLCQTVGITLFFEDKEGNTDLNLAMEKAINELGRRPNNNLSKN